MQLIHIILLVYYTTTIILDIYYTHISNYYERQRFNTTNLNNWNENLNLFSFFSYFKYLCTNKMEHNCDVCDKTIKIKSKSKHHQNLLHNEIDKCILINHTIEDLDFFDINEKI